MRALGGSGPLNWELARQFAAMGAVGDEPDPQPDPGVRYELNDLARVARMRLAAKGIGSELDAIEFLPVSRAEWARRTLADWQPLFGNLAVALSVPPSGDGTDSADNDGKSGGEPSSDPFAAMLSRLTAMVAPAMLGMAVGSMVGTLARGALGQYDLPLGRPAARELLVVSANLDAFARDWSVPIAEVRMWVLIHEIAAHAVLTAPGASVGVTDLVARHVTAFRPDASALSERFASFDPGDADAMAEAGRLLSDPTVLLGAVRTPEQEQMAPLLEAHVAALSARIDDIVDVVAGELLGSVTTLAEAVRRRRLETGSESVFIRTLFGLALSKETAEAGRRFIAGVRERAGERADEVLAHLVDREDGLPTPNELVAPGLWLARLSLD